MAELGGPPHTRPQLPRAACANRGDAACKWSLQQSPLWGLGVGTGGLGTGLWEVGTGRCWQMRCCPRGAFLGPIVGMQMVNHRLDEVRGGGVTAQVPRPDLKIQHREGETQGRDVTVSRASG